MNIYTLTIQYDFSYRAVIVMSGPFTKDIYRNWYLVRRLLPMSTKWLAYCPTPCSTHERTCMCSLAQPWTTPRDGWTRKTKRYCSVSKVMKDVHEQFLRTGPARKVLSSAPIKFPPNMELGRNWIPYLRQRKAPSDSPRVSV